jgi:hypothetical protein
MEAMKSELDLFATPLTQAAIEYGYTVAYKPVASLEKSSQFEFVIGGSGEELIDLAHTELHLHAKVTKSDGTNLSTADDKSNVTAPVNNWIHSLFSQVEVTLNGKQISSPSTTYGFRGYIESLLNYSRSAKTSHLTSGLWYKDTAGKFNDFKDNAGLLKRASFIRGSKTVDLMSNIHHELFGSDKLLINGVEMRLKFHLNKDAFHLMSEDTAVKTQISDATLFVRKVRVKPALHLAYSRALEHSNLKYPLSRTEIKNITIPTGVQSRTIDNIYLNHVPKRIVIGFVSNAAFNGDFGKNPFFFEHFNLNFLQLYSGSQQIPTKALTPDFTNNLYIRAYKTLFEGTGINSQDVGNDISREEFKDGYFLTVFDLTSDLSASSSHWSIQRNESFRIEVRFSTPLTTPVDMILYSEHDSLMEITKQRNVITDF